MQIQSSSQDQYFQNIYQLETEDQQTANMNRDFRQINLLTQKDKETVKPLEQRLVNIQEVVGDLSRRMNAVETTLNINRDREPSIHNNLSQEDRGPSIHNNLSQERIRLSNRLNRLELSQKNIFGNLNDGRSSRSRINPIQLRENELDPLGNYPGGNINRNNQHQPNQQESIQQQVENFSQFEPKFGKKEEIEKRNKEMIQQERKNEYRDIKKKKR